ncbi:MAG: hypothetical protein PHW73_14485 [Atribacterota bacterium]|nr:hypothetical protein [Atribacterota bacterium]
MTSDSKKILIYDDTEPRSSIISDQIVSARNISMPQWEIIFHPNIDDDSLKDIDVNTKIIFVHAGNSGTGPEDLFKKYSNKIAIFFYTGGHLIAEWYYKTDWTIYLTTIGANGFASGPLNRFFKDWAQRIDIDENASPPFQLLIQKSSPDNLMALVILCQGFLSVQGTLSKEDWGCINKDQIRYELEEVGLDKDKDKTIIRDFVEKHILNANKDTVNKTLSALQHILEK